VEDLVVGLSVEGEKDVRMAPTEDFPKMEDLDK